MEYMPNKPEIHLSIPSLFAPLEQWNNNFKLQVKCDNLSTLFTSLEFAGAQKVHGLTACFFSMLGLNGAELPVAHYRVQAHQETDINVYLSEREGESKSKSGILCADPVHFEVGMNDITLTDTITDLSESEAKEILELLNDHFQQDELKFVYGSNQHWYVTYPEEEAIQTTPLEAVIKKNIVGRLPSSDKTNDTTRDAKNWKQIQNEVQMLLHSSEVNRNREIAGLETVNSLWFWGGGKPKKDKSGFKMIFTNNDQLNTEIQGKMFAKAAACEWQKLPENGEELLTQLQHKAGKSYVLLDQIQQAVIEENFDAYQLELTRIDEEYIKPLMQAWKNNQIDLIIDGADGSLIRPLRNPAWKFWKKPLQLFDIAAAINNQ